MLEVNSKKTKIMIFQKRAKKLTDNFHTGKDVIDLVHEYTYLVTRISSNGNFNVSQEDLNLKDKALHPLISLGKHLGGALSPQGSPPLGGALSPQGKKETILINLRCYLPFLTYLLCFVALDCEIFLCQG